VPEKIEAATPKIFKPTPEVISRAADIIKNGGLVAFPTETVYGLGTNALDESAVRKIYEAKGRPSDNPLILHVSDMREASRYASINDVAETLMEHFWPGPLTIVLYALDNVPLSARGGLDTVALRAPLNFIALDLIRKCGVPIAAPSANRSGRPSPTSAGAVWDDLGNNVDMIIDGGSTAIGVESTVIDATGENISILRPGGVTRKMLEHIADVNSEEAERAEHRSPGTRYKHYAPSIEVRLWDIDGYEVFEQARNSWCYVGIRTPPDGCVKKIVFSSPDEYAHGLFSTMRELEKCGAKLIIADLPENAGLGEAIRNRLFRAAGKPAS
jgi:L-threonylcarbamoyladenylate synthase